MVSFQSIAFAVVVVLSCGFFAVGRADVSSLRANRFGRLQQLTQSQRQEASPTPYPAAGFRPDRQFSRPSPEESRTVFAEAVQDEQQENNFDQLPPAERPEPIYGAPARLQFKPQQQQQPQFTYAAPQLIYSRPAERLTSPPAKSQRLTKAKPARLTADREDLEDEEEEDIDVDPKQQVKSVAQPQPQAQPQPVAGGATVTYFPAGAVNFLNPGAVNFLNPGAAPGAYSLPTANFFAKLQSQPTFYAAAAQPQLVAQPYLQPTPTAAYYAAPAQLRAW